LPHLEEGVYEKYYKVFLKWDQRILKTCQAAIGNAKGPNQFEPDILTIKGTARFLVNVLDVFPYTRPHGEALVKSAEDLIKIATENSQLMVIHTLLLGYNQRLKNKIDSLKEIGRKEAAVVTQDSATAKRASVSVSSGTEKGGGSRRDYSGDKSGKKGLSQEKGDKAKDGASISSSHKRKREEGEKEGEKKSTAVNGESGSYPRSSVSSSPSGAKQQSDAAVGRSSGTLAPPPPRGGGDKDRPRDKERERDRGDKAAPTTAGGGSAPAAPSKRPTDEKSDGGRRERDQAASEKKGVGEEKSKARMISTGVHRSEAEREKERQQDRKAPLDKGEEDKGRGAGSARMVSTGANRGDGDREKGREKEKERPREADKERPRGGEKEGKEVEKDKRGGQTSGERRKVEQSPNGKEKGRSRDRSQEGRSNSGGRSGGRSQNPGFGTLQLRVPQSTPGDGTTRNDASTLGKRGRDDVPEEDDRSRGSSTSKRSKPERDGSSQRGGGGREPPPPQPEASGGNRPKVPPNLPPAANKDNRRRR